MASVAPKGFKAMLKSELNFNIDLPAPSERELERERVALLGATGRYRKAKRLEQHLDKYYTLYKGVTQAFLLITLTWIWFSGELDPSTPLTPAVFVLASLVIYALSGLVLKKSKAWARQYTKRFETLYTGVKECLPEHILELRECIKAEPAIQAYLTSLSRAPVMGEYLMLFRYARTRKVLARKEVERYKAEQIKATWIHKGGESEAVGQNVQLDEGLVK